MMKKKQMNAFVKLLAAGILAILLLVFGGCVVDEKPYDDWEESIERTESVDTEAESESETETETEEDNEITLPKDEF